jgi:hypothetical protein
MSRQNDPDGCGVGRFDLRPLDVEPVSVRAPFDVRRPLVRDVDAVRADYLAALREPLAAISLGAHDERILAWLAGWDLATVGAVASLLHRARASAPLQTGGGR